MWAKKKTAPCLSMARGGILPQFEASFDKIYSP